MTDRMVVNMRGGSFQELAEHIIRAGERGQDLVINGFHVDYQTVETLSLLYCHIDPEFTQEIVENEYNRRYQGG